VLKAQPSIWLRPTTSVRTVPVSVTLPSGVTVARVLVGDNVDCSTPGGSTAVPTSTTLSSGADRTAIVRLVVHDTLNNCLTASAPVVIDTVNPTVGAYLAPATPPQQNVLNARWGFADAAPSSGLDVLLVDIYRYGVSDPVYSFETRKRGFVFGGQEGSQWRVDATGVDTAGNLSPLKWARFSVPWDDKSFTRTGSWSRSANASDYAGSQLVSASKGATATRVVSGRYFHALITRHPQGGYADVYVDGHKTTSPINFYSATVQHTVYVNIANYSTPGFHTVKFVVRGAHPSGSGGNYVFLDGLRATK
jgi:hypothetical protein